MRAGNLYSTNTGNNSSLVATASVWNLVRTTRCPRIFLMTFLFASTWFCVMGVIFNHWNTSRLKYHSVYSSHLPFCLRPHATSGSTYSACLNLKEDRGDPADRDNGSTSAAAVWGQMYTSNNDPSEWRQNQWQYLAVKVKGNRHLQMMARETRRKMTLCFSFDGQ